MLGGSTTSTLLGQTFFEKQTTASNVRLTVNNLGAIGNSFRGSFSIEDFSSCEYPANSNIEHIFDGGLWVGAIVGGQELVSTGAVDDVNGYTTGDPGYEFSAAAGAQFNERSSLLDNPLFDINAVSHQDFVSDFSDQDLIVPGTQTPILDHDFPLNADVHFESYNWNFAFSDFFVLLNYEITNGGATTWDSVYVGFWTDAVVRNIAITPAGSGGTEFYNKGGTGYIDSLRIGYEFDAAGDLGFTESYVGVQYLGAELNGELYTPELRPDFEVNFNSWQFRSFGSNQFSTPGNDQQRYLKMRTSLLDDTLAWENTIQEQIRQPRNSSFFVSAGPFARVAPGETVTATFAVVLARKFEDGNPTPANTPAQRTNLVRHSGWAQSAFNGEDINGNGVLDPGEDRDQDGQITRFILPSPPDIPFTRYEEDESGITIYWADNAESSIDPISNEQDFEGYRVYKTETGFDVQGAQDLTSSLKLVAQWDSLDNEVGLNNGFSRIRLPQPVTFEGDTNQYVYSYRLNGVLPGWQHAVSLTAFDRGEPENDLEPLESSRIANLKRVFPGTPGNRGFQAGDPFVYPNPYYGAAAWEGAEGGEEGRRIMFANLPPRCEVRIYTVAGDLIYNFKHDQNYDGSNAEWFNRFSNPEENQIAGGEHAWDLLSNDRQIIARGLYVFSVEDLDTGDIRQGKFIVIK